MQPPTFEQAYQRHEFSELVRLTIACAVMIRRFLDRNLVVPPTISEVELPVVPAPVVLAPDA